MPLYFEIFYYLRADVLFHVCIFFNFSDALLPNELPEASGGRVTVNDEDAEYTRRDPLEVLSLLCMLMGYYL